MNQPIAATLQLSADITTLLREDRAMTLYHDGESVVIECGCSDCDPAGVVVARGADVLEALADLRVRVGGEAVR